MKHFMLISPKELEKLYRFSSPHKCHRKSIPTVFIVSVQLFKVFVPKRTVCEQTGAVIHILCMMQAFLQKHTPKEITPA